MRIATWNVNSVKQRLEHLKSWLDEAQPDVVCLQELKCVDDAFPRTEVEEAGYVVATHGQKGFNGVALLARQPLPLREVRRGLPGDAEDAQSRYIEALIPTPAGDLRVASIYLPNGNPVGTPKYDYKLAFLRRLTLHARALRAREEVLVLAGDYNVIPEPGHYSFWDYQAGAWQKNNGILIDHILLSPMAADHLAAAWIDKHTRGWDKPSDHVPVVIELDYAVD